MTRKFYESMRRQDIEDAKCVIRQASKFRRCGNYSGKYHEELMQVAHMHIEFARYASRKARG